MQILENQNYNEAITALTSQGKFRISLGLERVLKILQLFDNPHKNLKCIHVAGTNGKGSTCAILASVLKEAGYKTGLYTSPHLVNYTERIKINGYEISKNGFAEIVLNIIKKTEGAGIPATEFEILTVAAFIYFKNNKTDIAVFETGLGGRLDATNVIQNPLASIITTIGLDHTDRLGSSIEEIAMEKAGIIKPNCTIITLKNNAGLNVLQKEAKIKNSPLILADEKNKDDFNLSLKGLWQRKNLALAEQAVEILRDNGFCIDECSIESGLKNTKWNGRFQYINKHNIIVDGAHNPNAAALLRDSLDLYYPSPDRIWIYSSIGTKDYKQVMKELFREQDIVIFTKSSSGAAVSPNELEQQALAEFKTLKTYIKTDIKQSFELYNILKSPKNIGIIAGSLYTIGDFFSLSI